MRAGLQRLFGLGALVLAVAACARDTSLSEASPPETQIEDYEVVLEGAPSEDVAELAEESLSVYRLQDEGAQSRAFLRRRAEGDLPTIVKILHSRGFFDGTATVDLSPLEAEEIVVTFRLKPGEAYRLTTHRFALAPSEPTPPLDPAALGSPVGRAAEAAPIVAAEDAAVGALRRAGFAYAAFEGREALADRETKTLEVTSRIAPGRKYAFGPVRFAGVESVPEDYLETYVPWREGETYDESDLKEYQRRLAETGLFTSVTVEPPREPPAGPALPLRVRAEERRPRT
ncbi:MAG TPA: POTRA domain-containing protein, partial [Paracoccaceae bacterium]|nr:POTRA domain-containing protein [Paracoccaceae bacterium]